MTICGSKNPDGGYVCNRERGHTGWHMATVGPTWEVGTSDPAVATTVDEGKADPSRRGIASSSVSLSERETLPEAILSLPSVGVQLHGVTSIERAYQMGHRDARHAASKLAFAEVARLQSERETLIAERDDAVKSRNTWIDVTLSQQDRAVTAEAEIARLSSQLAGLRTAIKDVTDTVEATHDHTAWFPALARLAALAASQERTPCRYEPHISRVCEHGTGGCNVRHGAQEPTT